MVATFNNIKYLDKEMIIKPFKNISKKDVALAGGKGASLGEMSQVGIPVPSGFVILSTTFDKFLEETDLNVEINSILDKVITESIHTVEDASEQIRSLILNFEIPKNIEKEIFYYFKTLNSKFVAVRSSATSEDSASAAWAGQLETYLNTTEKNLLENVKKCWASLFTPRAIFYRFEKKLNKSKISVAVVVQKMVESEKSGIAFSVHPITQDKNQVIIEAGYGLGEAIVSGSITPNSYTVEKNPRRIIDKNIFTQNKGLYRKEEGGNEWKEIPKEAGKKQTLSEKEIFELTEIILKIEKHYGFPCDIEWAMERGKFYITQSRPITTLIENKKEYSFLDKKWTKIWTTEYSMFSVWLFGREYIEDCRKEIGYGFDDIIFLIEGDLATVYRDNLKQKEFVDFLAKKSLLNKDFHKKIIGTYLKLNDCLIDYTKLSEKDALNIKNLQRFIEAHKKFIAYFLTVLWSPNGFNSIDIEKKFKEKVLREYEEARKLTEKTYPIIEKFLQKLFSYIARKESINEKLLRALLPEDLINYTKSKKLPSKKILKERYEYCVFVSTLAGNKIYLSKEAEKIIEKISHIDVEGISQIKGSIGNKGIALGKVKKIFMEKEMNKFKQGEILVTTMTRPEWLPIMKIAGGFITDAGGILSHAAIVSRELNKPCIIGTGTATQILKDGDLVEVNADKGIVKILKKVKDKK